MSIRQNKTLCVDGSENTNNFIMSENVAEQLDKLSVQEDKKEDKKVVNFIIRLFVATKQLIFIVSGKLSH